MYNCSECQGQRYFGCDWSYDKLEMLQNVQLLRILERRSDNTFQFHVTAWNLSDSLSLQKMLLSDFPPQIGLKFELEFKDWLLNPSIKFNDQFDFSFVILSLTAAA